MRGAERMEEGRLRVSCGRNGSNSSNIVVIVMIVIIVTIETIVIVVVIVVLVVTVVVWRCTMLKSLGCAAEKVPRTPEPLDSPQALTSPYIYI